MTPQEKAIELVYKYYNKMNPDAPDCNISFNQCKQCALMAVDEIIKETKLHDKTIYQHGRTFYWQEVEQEIEKL